MSLRAYTSILLCLLGFLNGSAQAVDMKTELLLCAVEMIEEQYDEGASVQVGLEALLHSQYSGQVEFMKKKCQEDLVFFRKSREPVGLSYMQLTELKKNPNYRPILDLLPHQPRQLKVVEVARKGLSFGLGVALTVGWQTKILETPLGRRYRVKRLRNPLQFGFGTGWSSYTANHRQAHDLVTGAWVKVSPGQTMVKASQSPRVDGEMSHHCQRNPCSILSNNGVGYGFFYRSGFDLSAKKGLLTSEMEPDFSKILNTLAYYRRKNSTVSTDPTKPSDFDSDCEVECGDDDVSDVSMDHVPELRYIHLYDNVRECLL